jgi:hypothetical protein
MRAATQAPAADNTASPQRMKLRYGFNEIDGWPAFSLSDNRTRIHRRLRLMDTKIIRVFVFDKPVPDPFKEWHWFAAMLQAVLDCGAKPMVTFAKFPPPYDTTGNIGKFVSRCCEIVWGCLEQWGGEEVGDWYWCVWNEPNNPDIGGDVSYAQYRRIYQEVGGAVLELLEPHLHGRRARLGGPSIDGTQRAFWMDWIAQLVADFDDRMLGFVNWHMYADWRPAVPAETVNVMLWGAPDAPNGEVFKALAMAQTPQYAARAGRRPPSAWPRHPQCLRRAEYGCPPRAGLHLRSQPERFRRGVLRLCAHPSDTRRCGPGDAMDGNLQAVGFRRRYLRADVHRR